MEDEDKSNISRKLTNKLCGVCGDKALGYNFNAVTCESCKAFFRRNALISKEFKCPFSEQCQITILTRRFCQKCRLDKCFAIGMVKEYIMSDEDKAQKRKKIAENKAKKRNHHQVGDDEVSSSKLIKREDNDDSGNSWNQNGKGYTPSSDDENRHHVEIPQEHFRNIPNGNNQAVSVIKNNVSEARVENVVCDSTPYNVMVKKSDTYQVSYANDYERKPVSLIQQPRVNIPYNQHVPSSINMHGNMLNNNIGTVMDKDNDNKMIRSMLTTSPPGDDVSRIYSTVPGNGEAKQPLCDNNQASSSRGFQNKEDVARDVLQDVERIQVEPKSMKLILCEAIKLEFETYTSLPQSSSRELNDAERARLNELIVANKALLAPLDDYMPSLVNVESHFKASSQGQNDPMLLGIINLTAVAIRRLIKMAKKINAFKNMCEEDQVSLLKGGCTEMMILRSTMTYDCARDTWKVPHSQESMSSIKAEILKLAKGNIYQEHDRFVRTFDAKWRTDENIILIMCAIVLFTPTRPRVVHSDVIKLEQNSYYYLLRRYLESIYPGCEAKSAFLKLIQKIMELQKLAEEIIGVYLDVNPSDVEPLLIEIFDLKQPQ